MRADREYDKLYDKAQEFARKIGINVPEVSATVALASSKRIQQTSNRLKEYLTTSTTGTIGIFSEHQSKARFVFASNR